MVYFSYHLSLMSCCLMNFGNVFFFIHSILEQTCLIHLFPRLFNAVKFELVDNIKLKTPYLLFGLKFCYLLFVAI